MLSQTVLLALAGAASANFLQLRQDFDIPDVSDECIEAAQNLESVYSEMPTRAPSAYESWLSEVISSTITDPCMPTDVASAVESWMSGASSFYSANGDILSSVAEACSTTVPPLSSIASQFAIPTCGSGSGSSSNNDDSDDDNDAEGSSNNDDDDDDDDDDDSQKDAATRPAGLVGAAVALAGFLGVVLAL